MCPDQQLMPAQRLQITANRGTGHAERFGQGAHVDGAVLADLIEDRTQPFCLSHESHCTKVKRIFDCAPIEHSAHLARIYGAYLDRYLITRPVRVKGRPNA
jgi:hypothetical protein